MIKEKIQKKVVILVNKKESINHRKVHRGVQVGRNPMVVLEIVIE
jgi:hypothetical protein